MLDDLFEDLVRRLLVQPVTLTCSNCKQPFQVELRLLRVEKFESDPERPGQYKVITGKVAGVCPQCFPPGGILAQQEKEQVRFDGD